VVSGSPATDGGSDLVSCFYEGAVVHDRASDPPHRLKQRVLFIMLDLREVDRVFSSHPLWSSRHWNLVRFKRADYLGPARVPLDDAVRDLVFQRTGVRPSGPVKMLTTLRVWGWSFNPITCYYCLSPADGSVEHLVAEVTNTPWGERHAYVVGPAGEHRFDKEFHVSPFMPMDMSYVVRYQNPGERLSLSFDVEQAGVTRLRASMALSRRPITRSTLLRMALRPWLGSIGFTVAIYVNALSLTRRGARFYRHPVKEAKP